MVVVAFGVMSAVGVMLLTTREEVEKERAVDVIRDRCGEGGKG